MGQALWAYYRTLLAKHRKQIMVEEVRRFLLDESGPELVEWAMVTMVLLLATGLILIQIYDEVIRVMEQLLQQLIG